MSTFSTKSSTDKASKLTLIKTTSLLQTKQDGFGGNKDIGENTLPPLAMDRDRYDETHSFARPSTTLIALSADKPATAALDEAIAGTIEPANVFNLKGVSAGTKKQRQRRSAAAATKAIASWSSLSKLRAASDFDLRFFNSSKEILNISRATRSSRSFWSLLGHNLCSCPPSESGIKGTGGLRFFHNESISSSALISSIKTLRNKLSAEYAA
mmetsp:Transcript_21021/g.54287  ORF Transcript_21021/g.54287 Transcript_21021/m.54287 type:complete len:212 (+) Transcript_21021:3521-4156(+)